VGPGVAAAPAMGQFRPGVATATAMGQFRPGAVVATAAGVRPGLAAVTAGQLRPGVVPGTATGQQRMISPGPMAVRPPGLVMGGRAPTTAVVQGAIARAGPAGTMTPLLGRPVVPRPGMVTQVVNPAYAMGRGFTMPVGRPLGVPLGVPGTVPFVAGTFPAPGLAAGVPIRPKRALSPHAGSRAIREEFKERLKGAKEGAAAGAAKDKSASRSRSRSRSSASSASSKSQKNKGRKKKKAKTSSSSTISSSSSSRAKKKKKKAKKSKSKKDKSRSRSRSRSKEANEDQKKTITPEKLLQESSTEPQEVKEAKMEALEKLRALQKVEPKEDRLREWRKLLRAWHPDKNPDKVEVATAVFQFLQKGKKLVEGMA